MGNLCSSDRKEPPQAFQSKQQGILSYNDVEILILQGKIEDEKTSVILNASDDPYDTQLMKRISGIDKSNQLQLGEPVLIRLGNNNKILADYIIHLKLPIDFDEKQGSVKRGRSFFEAFKLADDTELEILSYTNQPIINSSQEKNAENFLNALFRFLESRKRKGIKCVKLVNLDQTTVKIYQKQLMIEQQKIGLNLKQEQSKRHNISKQTQEDSPVLVNESQQHNEITKAKADVRVDTDQQQMTNQSFQEVEEGVKAVKTIKESNVEESKNAEVPNQNKQQVQEDKEAQQNQVIEQSQEQTIDQDKNQQDQQLKVDVPEVHIEALQEPPIQEQNTNQDQHNNNQIQKVEVPEDHVQTATEKIQEQITHFDQHNEDLKQKVEQSVQRVIFEQEQEQKINNDQDNQDQLQKVLVPEQPLETIAQEIQEQTIDSNQTKEGQEQKHEQPEVTEKIQEQIPIQVTNLQNQEVQDDVAIIEQFTNQIITSDENSENLVQDKTEPESIVQESTEQIQKEIISDNQQTSEQITTQNQHDQDKIPEVSQTEAVNTVTELIQEQIKNTDHLNQEQKVVEQESHQETGTEQTDEQNNNTDHQNQEQKIVEQESHQETVTEQNQEQIKNSDHQNQEQKVVEQESHQETVTEQIVTNLVQHDENQEQKTVIEQTLEQIPIDQGQNPAASDNNVQAVIDVIQQEIKQENHEDNKEILNQEQQETQDKDINVGGQESIVDNQQPVNQNQDSQHDTIIQDSKVEAEVTSESVQEQEQSQEKSQENEAQVSQDQAKPKKPKSKKKK